MDVLQQGLDYAWQATVYMFLVWLIIYFFKEAGLKTKVLSCIACVSIVTLALSTDIFDQSIALIIDASDTHIETVNAKLALYS